MLTLMLTHKDWHDHTPIVRPPPPWHQLINLNWWLGAARHNMTTLNYRTSIQVSLRLSATSKLMFDGRRVHSKKDDCLPVELLTTTPPTPMTDLHLSIYSPSIHFLSRLSAQGSRACCSLSQLFDPPGCSLDTTALIYCATDDWKTKSVQTLTYNNQTSK